MSVTVRPVGDLLREWRQRRRLSQLELSLDAEISTRHLSFLETGRSQPSRDMVLRLAERLDVPLRDRNLLLHAAGYATVFPERPLDDPALRIARQAVDQVLAGHEPYPALAVDRHWTLIASNTATTRLLAGVDAALLQPPVNVLRMALHPSGMAPRTANLAEWRAHLLARLGHQIQVTGDPILARLQRELRDYPAPDEATHDVDGAAFVVPFRLITDAGTLAFFSTTTVFGTPVDVTLSELAVEAFYPADAATVDALRQMANCTRHNLRSAREHPPTTFEGEEQCQVRAHSVSFSATALPWTVVRRQGRWRGGTHGQAAEGPVQGFERNGVSTFLGIPYAAPPTGEQRWQPPQPAAAWTQTLNATSSPTPARRSRNSACSPAR